MKFSKKLLATILSVLMVVTAFPITALAATNLTKNVCGISGANEFNVVLNHNGDYVATIFTNTTKSADNTCGEATINVGESFTTTMDSGSMTNEVDSNWTSKGWHYGSKASGVLATWYQIGTNVAYTMECSDSSITCTTSGWGASTYGGDSDWGPNWNNQASGQTTFTTSEFTKPGDYVLTVKYKIQMKNKKYTSWSTSYELETSDTINLHVVCPHSNTSVTRENVVDATCAKDGSYDEVTKCSDCGKEISRIQKTIPATGKHTSGDAVIENEVKATGLAGGSYDEVVYCSVCGAEISRETKTTDKLDTSAYEAALEEAEALAQSKKYTPESREIYAFAVEHEEIDLGAVTDFADIERATEAILACKSELKVAGYTVDFVVKYSDGTEDVNVDYGVVDYGTLQTFDATEYLNDGTITKWVVVSNDGTTVMPTNNASIDVSITEDTVVTVSVSVVPVEEETVYHAIKVANASGRVVDVKYVADGESFSTDSLVAEAIPFYEFKEWYVHNDADLTNVTTDIVISPVYTPIDDKCIYINGVDGVTVKGKNSANEDTSGTQIKVPYDSLVTINGSAKYAFCNETGDVIYSYITGNKIHAPKNNKNVYIKVVTEAKASTTVTGSFVLERDGGKKGASFNCQFYLPEDATLVECGAIATVREEIANGDSFVIGTSKVNKIVSKTQSSLHEYTCTFVSTFTGFDTLYGKSYLIYDDAEGRHTIYSETEVLSLNI